MKKTLALLLCAAMALSCLTGCVGRGGSASSSEGGSSAGSSSSSAASSTSGSTSQPDPAVLPKLMVMSGPTGVGAAKLMADNEAAAEGEKVLASSTVVADNEAVKNALINGDADIAAVATNMAATLANKTGGALQVLAINTLGVLYILEKNQPVASMADLAGKTLYATGQGANPEYILNYLLTHNGVDPADVDIQWMTAQEVIAQMTTGESGICMLPVPAATTVMMKDAGINQAISLSQEWDKLGGGALAQGCIVARTEYVQQNPQAVEAFLAAYADSIAYMSGEDNRADAAALVAQYGITANDKMAANAIDQCNLTFITGQEMKDILVSFYDVMFQADPASIGGAMPADSFYYGVE